MRSYRRALLTGATSGIGAAFAASKVFDPHFAEALAEEMRRVPVDILTICPGTTQTSFGVRAGYGGGMQVIRRQDDVLEPAYEADPDGRCASTSRRREYSWRRWGCWQGITGMSDSDYCGSQEKSDPTTPPSIKRSG